MTDLKFYETGYGGGMNRGAGGQNRSQNRRSGGSGGSGGGGGKDRWV